MAHIFGGPCIAIIKERQVVGMPSSRLKLWKDNARCEDSNAAELSSQDSLRGDGARVTDGRQMNIFKFVTIPLNGMYF